MNTPNNKRRRTSQKKVESALVQLLQTRELSDITITDICKLAQVNRTTFYSNYEDIYALVAAVQHRLEEEVMELYREEWEQRRSSHNFLKLFEHIRDNQLFYKTYFKLGMDGKISTMFDLDTALRYYEEKYIDQYVEYHIEFFRNGLNAVLKKWLQNDCRESPEEIMHIISSEYFAKIDSQIMAVQPADI